MVNLVRPVTSPNTRRAINLAACLVFCLRGGAEEAVSYSIQWNTNSSTVTVEVAGISEVTIEQLKSVEWEPAKWQKLLSVYVRQGDFLSDMSVPPMLGEHVIADGRLRFGPRFPLERGVNYRAVFRPGNLPGADPATKEVISTFRLEPSLREPATVVSQVFPSADVLPENLLKFYVHFSAPMRRGHIYDHIGLRQASGKLVELPFLEIDEELWNPEMTRLTLFIDPGRIKHGVRPLEEIGPALEEGKSYTLEIASAWQDCHGLPLRQAFSKRFKVGPPDRDPPSPAKWAVTLPRAGTEDKLFVNFREPMDEALALRVINVVDPEGGVVTGARALSDHEQQWSFKPEQPWKSGTHQLLVQNTIEDLAGNNIGKRFEVDLFEGVQRRFTNSVVRLPFEVQ